MTLAGKTAFVVGAETPLGDGIALALADAGASVHRHNGLLASREDVVAPGVDGIDVVVHAAQHPHLFEQTDLDEADEATWTASVDSTVMSTLFALQGAFDNRDATGCRVVVALPVIGLTGLAKFTHLGAAVEAQRLLCKSAARQWATDAVTVNCVVVGLAHFAMRPIDDEVALPARVFGDEGDSRSDVGPIVAFLASDAAHFVTGVTITADGSVPLHP